MRLPLSLPLAPAPAMLAVTVLGHGLAAVVLLQVLASSGMTVPDFPGGSEILAVCAWALIGVSLLLSWRSEVAKRGLGVILHDDGVISTLRAGELADYRVDGSAVDFGWAVWLPLFATAGPKAGRGRICRRLLLLPANLPPGQWRILRLWLRHKAVGAEESGGS